MKTLKLLLEGIKAAMPGGIVILQGTGDQNAVIIASMNHEHKADILFKSLVGTHGGRGGGKSGLAQGVLEKPVDQAHIQSMVSS